MATSLSTNGGNHYNGGDYADACATWSKSFAVFKNLETRRAPTETDRKNGMAELRN
jgi:hypothetical protein